jgi:hypothetical protein
MSQYGAPIPDGYEPEDWPHRWCSYEQARGFVTRIRAEGSGEGKVIAEEYGVSRRSVTRAVRWYLISTQQYEPDQWFRFQRERKAEKRRWFLDKMAARDQEFQRANAQIKQARETLNEERATLERAERATHTASSYSEDSARKEHQREVQRKLNAKNRARAGL